MTLISEREIILLRDKMPVEELRKITNAVKEKQGYVSYREIFREMGYVHAFNDKWHVPKII